MKRHRAAALHNLVGAVALWNSRQRHGVRQRYAALAQQIAPAQIWPDGFGSHAPECLPPGNDDERQKEQGTKEVDGWFVSSVAGEAEQAAQE